MTLRALVLGLLLGLFISGATYFNDWVIGQTQLIGNQLPISVFGIAVLLLLAINPLFYWTRMLRGSEIAVITAIALAACGWPGSNFYRGFTQIAALPSHWYKTEADWQATQVFSYVPGASAEIGQGHVRDWRGLSRVIVPAKDREPSSIGEKLWPKLSPTAQRMFEDAARGQPNTAHLPQMTRALNEVLREVDLFDANARDKLPPRLREVTNGNHATGLERHDRVLLNRWLLVSTFPEYLMPPPSGTGVLLARGQPDPVAVDALLVGRSRDNRLSLGELPWSTWWPTIRLWGGVAMALALCAVCLALIVHPQWSKRELLPYPVARFIEEVAERRDDSLFPDIAKSKLFWAGFVTMASWHLVNGLHAWFDFIPEIPRVFDFHGLKLLFPNAAQVFGGWGYFWPTLYMSVVAFSFFMPTSVSFSLGIAQILFLMFGALMLSGGYALDVDILAGKKMNLLRFGAYLGIAMTIAYTGRRYYMNVLMSALGARRGKDTPSYATWAARGLAVSALLATLILNSAGLELFFAGLFVCLVLLMFVVVSRVATETGAFFIQAYWAPVGIISAMLGFEALGPTTFILLALASVMLVIDPRELLMPYLANGLRLVERTAGASPARISGWLVLMIVAGFFVAGSVTLYLEYNHGLIPVGSEWDLKSLPTLAFDGLSQHISEAAAHGTLAQATATSGWDRLQALRPANGTFVWMVAGIVLVLSMALARLRITWWPLHPVLFVVWGTYPMAQFGPSFLVGWMVKAGVVGTTGAKGYHSVKPLMVGVIAGELLSGLFWMMVGAGYFFVTGRTPVSYWVFPG